MTVVCADLHRKSDIRTNDNRTTVKTSDTVPGWLLISLLTIKQYSICIMYYRVQYTGFLLASVLAVEGIELRALNILGKHSITYIQFCPLRYFLLKFLPVKFICNCAAGIAQQLRILDNLRSYTCRRKELTPTSNPLITTHVPHMHETHTYNGMYT